MRATTLELWLREATRGLSSGSTAQVRREIQEHYESARDEALQAGASLPEADRRALASLGNPTTARNAYHNVLLTASEARLLREISWEARVVCSRRRWAFVLPLVTFCAAVSFFAVRQTYLGCMLLLGAAGLLLLLASPLLPIYTPARSRAFRALRWTWLAAMLLLAFWPDIRTQFWLLASCAWPILWVEWRLARVRSKLPRSQWPKLLHL